MADTNDILNQYKEQLLNKTALRKRATFTPEKYDSNRVLNSSTQANDTINGGLSGGYDANLGAANLNKQRDFANSLYGQLTGNVPSYAEQQYKQGFGQQQSAKTALAASQRLGGGQLAASRRALLSQGADANQVANRDLAQIKAQQQLTNEDLYSNYTSQMRQQSASQAELKNRLVAEAMARMNSADISRIGLDTGTNLDDIRSAANSQNRQTDFINKLIGGGAVLGSTGLAAYASSAGGNSNYNPYNTSQFGQYSFGGATFPNQNYNSGNYSSIGQMPTFDSGER